MIEIRNVSKTFSLHNQGGTVIPVMTGGSFPWRRGNASGWWGPPGRGNPR
jgi:alpha-D-ribose 1-methylphosphonate 5-triphosphate synthase subunit PhnL